jgi:hypothetical protein
MLMVLVKKKRLKEQMTKSHSSSSSSSPSISISVYLFIFILFSRLLPIGHTSQSFLSNFTVLDKLSDDLSVAVLIAPS